MRQRKGDGIEKKTGKGGEEDEDWREGRTGGGRKRCMGERRENKPEIRRLGREQNKDGLWTKEDEISKEKENRKRRGDGNKGEIKKK